MQIKVYAVTEPVHRPAWDYLQGCGSEEYLGILAGLKETAEGELSRRNPVVSLGLSTRAANVLRYAKIESLGELNKLTTEQVRNLHMCGRKARHEIRTAAAAVGFDLPNWDESLFPRWP